MYIKNFLKTLLLYNFRIHFAGTESATVWFGFLSGAVQSGLRVANEILMELRPQTVTSDDVKLCEMAVPNKFDFRYEYPWWKIIAVVGSTSIAVTLCWKLVKR